MPRKLLVLVVFLLLSSPVMAQRSTTRGFSLGGSVVGATVDPEDGDKDSGGGLGIELGYGFRNGISLFLGGAGARMTPEDEGEEYTLGLGELGVRYNFLRGEQRWRPFVEAALGSVHVEFENVDFLGLEDRDVTVSGPAFTVGGGVGYYLNAGWSLGAALRWSAGSFDQVKLDNVTVSLSDEEEFDLRTTRLELRLTHFFSAN